MTLKGACSRGSPQRADLSNQAKRIAEYIEGLVIGQGRRAGERFKLLPWQKRFLSGAFGKPGDAALSMGRGNGKTTFAAGDRLRRRRRGRAACRAYGGMLADSFELRSRSYCVSPYASLPSTDIRETRRRAAWSIQDSRFGESGNDHGQGNGRDGACSWIGPAPLARGRAEAVVA